MKIKLHKVFPCLHVHFENLKSSSLWKKSQETEIASIVAIESVECITENGLMGDPLLFHCNKYNKTVL